MTSIEDIVKKMNELNKKYGFNWHGKNNDIELWWNCSESDFIDIVYDYEEELSNAFDDIRFRLDFLYDNIVRIEISEFSTNKYERNKYEPYIGEW